MQGEKKSLLFVLESFFINIISLILDTIMIKWICIQITLLKQLKVFHFSRNIRNFSSDIFFKKKTCCYNTYYT